MVGAFFLHVYNVHRNVRMCIRILPVTWQFHKVGGQTNLQPIDRKYMYTVIKHNIDCGCKPTQN